MSLQVMSMLKIKAFLKAVPFSHKGWDYCQILGAVPEQLKLL